MPTLALLVAVSAAPSGLPVAPPPRPVAVADIAVAWRNRVSNLPDPTRNGAPQPVLSGRLFLYTADECPAGVDGQLVVELVDGKGTLREKWVFTPDVLSRLAEDGRARGGYVLCLPLSSRSPGSPVRLVTRYEPTGGGPTRMAVSIVDLGPGER
jgi:hypothetical protein